MQTIEIYHFEDESKKRRWLTTIIERLNARGKEDQIEFVDKLGSSWDELIRNPDLLARTIWDAANNDNAICLVDIVLFSPDPDPSKHPYREAANIITRMLADSGLEQVNDTSNRLVSILKTGSRVEDVKLAGVMAALFQYHGTRFAWASSLKLWAQKILPTEFQSIPSFSFPQGDDDLNVNEQLVVSARDEIYRLALCSSWLNPEEFLEKAIDLGHPNNKQDQEAAGDLLRLFLRMSRCEFSSNFEVDGDLHANVLEGLKCISGARSGLDLQGAWLLAFGVHRSLFPSSSWRARWDSASLCKYPAGRGYFVAHSVKEAEDKDSRSIRLSTLRSYTDLCERIFKHDERDDTDLLLGVRLQPTSLEFAVDIPFQPFRDTLVQVFRKARGEEIDFGTKAHDTSSAVLRFVVSSHFKLEADDAIVSPNAPLRIKNERGGTHVVFQGCSR